MNKLVIIGNGFDLAHGLKTSYSDFVLWYVNKIFKRHDSPKDEDLIKIISNLVCEEFESLSQVKERYHISNFELIFKDYFFKSVYDNACEKRWVDIELEYYKQLKLIYDKVEKNGSGIIPDSYKIELVNLNRSFDLIKIELEEYLTDIVEKNVVIKPEFNAEIKVHFINDLIGGDPTITGHQILFLNFNYTATIETYLKMFSESRCKVNYIHGRLNDKDNPVIFGYGDESDSYYEKMEKLNEDEFLKHLKSNNYHRTSNYRNLFKFLGSDKFNVYVMGHSCGLSDKVLLSSIFEHQNLNEIKLFYYQKDENNNDYLEKTQQLARHIKLESRKKFKENTIPLQESLPLTKFKQQN